MTHSGIIGECELVRRFDSIKPYLSMPIDVMHLLFENVAPQLVAIWVGDINTQKEHAYLSKPSIRRKVDRIIEDSGSGIVDSIRRPRGLMEKGRWKADEWRTFVLTTSLVALHQFVPDSVLSGWFLFCLICELTMRPVIEEEDMEDLSNLCLQFFRHYSDTYYGGDEKNSLDEIYHPFSSAYSHVNKVLRPPCVFIAVLSREIHWNNQSLNEGETQLH